MTTEVRRAGCEVLVNRRTTTHYKIWQVMVLGGSGRVLIGIYGGFIDELNPDVLYVCNALSQ